MSDSTIGDTGPQIETLSARLEAILGQLRENADRLAGEIFEFETMFDGKSLIPSPGATLDSMIADIVEELKSLRGGSE